MKKEIKLAAVIFVVSFAIIHLIGVGSFPEKIHAALTTRTVEGTMVMSKDLASPLYDTLEDAKKEADVVVKEGEKYRAYDKTATVEDSVNHNAIINDTNYEYSILPEIDNNGNDILVASNNVYEASFRKVADEYYTIAPYVALQKIFSTNYLYLKASDLSSVSKFSDLYQIDGQDPQTYWNARAVTIAGDPEKYTYDEYYFRYDSPGKATFSVMRKDGTVEEKTYKTSRHVYDFTGNEWTSGSTTVIEENLSRVNTDDLAPGTYVVALEYYKGNTSKQSQLLFIKNA